MEWKTTSDLCRLRRRGGVCVCVCVAEGWCVWCVCGEGLCRLRRVWGGHVLTGRCPPPGVALLVAPAESDPSISLGLCEPPLYSTLSTMIAMICAAPDRPATLACARFGSCNTHPSLFPQFSVTRRRIAEQSINYPVSYHHRRTATAAPPHRRTAAPPPPHRHRRTAAPPHRHRHRRTSHLLNAGLC